MTIAVGDKLPDLKLKERTPDGPVDISTDDLFKGRRVVLFAVPGATHTCGSKVAMTGANQPSSR